MRPSILIVDDAQPIRRALRRILEGAGFLVTDAEDVEAALDRLDRGPVDMLLTDVQMPGRSGVDLARIVTDRFPSIKVVMMSTFEDVGRLPRELGIEAALAKPMKPAALLGAVRAALAG